MHNHASNSMSEATDSSNSLQRQTAGTQPIEAVHRRDSTDRNVSEMIDVFEIAISNQAYVEDLSKHLEKRAEHMRGNLNLFMLYFIFHGVFFLIFVVQNYFFYDESRFQYCFFVLFVFYVRFIVDHIR